jgi:hypothetical protein
MKARLIFLTVWLGAIAFYLDGILKLKPLTVVGFSDGH